MLSKKLLKTKFLANLFNFKNKKQSTSPKNSQYIIIPKNSSAKQNTESKITNSKAKLIKKLSLINGYVCQAEEKIIKKLQTKQSIARIDADLILQINKNEEEEEVIPWGVKTIQALEAWAHFRKVQVGVIDTGVDLNHHDLAPIKKGVNIAEPKSTPQDFHGHGTHISGTIAGRKNGKGVLGIVPDAELYPIQIFDKQGEAHLSSLIEALEWSIDNQLQVLNMSFGTTEHNYSLKDAVQKAYQAGVIMVAAAGNNSTSPIEFPARYPEVIGVGAVNKENKPASFSNYGPELDLLAPGVKIKSTWKNNSFRKLNGTSMAAAHVSGAIAFLLSIFNKLQPLEVKEILKTGAYKLDGVPTCKQGAGVVNALASIKIAQEMLLNGDK